MRITQQLKLAFKAAVRLEKICQPCKVFSCCCLCSRIITFVSNEIAFWQRGYLEKRDRQELVFLLKTEIDDFKHLSTKMILTFIDFVDAFVSVSHDFIFECLERFNIPRIYIEIIKDL